MIKFIQQRITNCSVAFPVNGYPACLYYVASWSVSHPIQVLYTVTQIRYLSLVVSRFQSTKLVLILLVLRNIIL